MVLIMKRKNDLYKQLLDLRNIIKVYNKQIKLNTKNKHKIEKYENYLLLNFVNIKQKLENRDFKFDKYFIFLIKEPKYRIIMSQTINDKLVNHLVAKYILLSVFEPILLDCNVATRKNKGTLYGVSLVKRYINEMKHKKTPIYYLKCDISKYFYTIDHFKLMNILSSKIKDKDALFLLENILKTTNYSYISERINYLKDLEREKIKNLNISSNNKEILFKQIDKVPSFNLKNKGIPIGSMTSQAFAIIYLNDLDHYIKEQLHIKYYVRYMDDFVLFHHDKEYLKYCYKVIKDKIENEYYLQLNPKSSIGMISKNNALNFLGYRYYLSNTNKLYMKIRNNTKRKFKRKVKKMYRLCQNNKLDYYSFKQVLASYKGHFKYADTYNFQRKIFSNHNFFEIITLGYSVKIDEYGDVVKLKG